MLNDNESALPVVFAECSTTVGWDGRTLYLREGQVWDARDPFVRARPDLFMAAPRVLCTTVDPSTLNTPVGDADAVEAAANRKRNPAAAGVATTRKPRQTRSHG